MECEGKGISEELIGGEVAQISCNLDDMTPEDLSYAMELLLSEGALDVYTIPVGMKKNRAGVLLTCICSLEQERYMAELMLKHTTTLGVRVNIMRRYKLHRAFTKVETEYGTVQIKEAYGPGIQKWKAEYEDLRRIAQENGCTIREIKECVEEKYGCNRGEH